MGSALARQRFSCLAGDNRAGVRGRGGILRLRRGWLAPGRGGRRWCPHRLLGAVVNRQVDRLWLMLAFAAIIIAVGVQMRRLGAESGGVCDLPGGGVAWRGHLPHAVGEGSRSGFSPGVLVSAAASLFVPALVVALGLRSTGGALALARSRSPLATRPADD